MKNMPHISLTILFLFSFLSMEACKKSGPKPTAVVAKVNDRSIVTNQLQERLSGPGSRASETSSDDGRLEEKRKMALDNLIDEEVVLQEAMKDGTIDRSERLRREVMREYFQNRLSGGKEQPTEAEVRAAFEAQKATLERVRARHILIKPTKPGDATSEVAARKKAEGVLSKLRAQGDKMDFPAMAKQLSDDPVTREKGGDLQFVTREKVVPEFAEALFALNKANDITDVVKTEAGYHIIQMTVDQRTFDQHKGSLRMMLARDKKKQLMETMLAELRKKALIKVYGDTVAKVQPAERPATAPIVQNPEL